MTPSSAELSRLTREEKLALLRRLAEEQEPAARAVLGPAPDGPLPGEERAPRRHPVTFAQRRLWFLDRLEPGGSHNTIFRALRLHGPLDRAALAAALARIAARHGALRTRFEEIDGEPVQVVEPAALAAPRLSRVDLSGLGGGSGQVARQERERRLAALARDEAARPFDLERAPLVRFTLVELGGGRVGDQVGDPAEGEAALLIALHHIVADGWSLGILLRELSALYGAAVTEGSLDAADLPELATTYGAHARSQRERLSGEELARELELWRERLADAPTVLDLPSDRPRPALESFRGAIEPFALAPDTVAGVRALARSERATPFMVLLAAFAAVLARWAGRDDLLLGTPVAGRTRSELEPLIGFFANTLVLRADLRGGPGFRELLRRVRAHALVAFGHQEMPFERLVEELEDERDLSRNPLFQVMFALQNMPATSLGLEGLAVEQIPVERGLAKVDLTLDLVEPAGSPGWEAALRGYLEYNTDLFDRSTARRLVGAFRRIVDAAVRDPERPVGRLPMLAPAERHALTVEWQGAPGPGRPGSGRSAPPPVHQTILRRAAADPERTAVEAGGVRWSYGELDRASARVASRLRELGVGVEDRVGVLATRSAETIAGFLGVLRAGGAYVPLDPEYPDERLAFMASDAGVRAILVGEGLDARAGRVAPEAARRVPLGLCKGAGTLSEEAPCKGAGTVSASGEVAPEAAAYVLYTSGTTGRPKGVVVSHGALANHAAAVTAAYALAPDDRVLQFASVSFDIAGEEIYPTLARGAALVLRTPELSLEPRGLVRFVAERRLTVINIPTPLWHEWCRELERPRQGPDQNPLLPPEALRLVIVGTEGALPERLRAWSEALGRSGRDAPRWINAYGPTEATVTSTLHRVRPHEVEDGAARIPIGRPVAGLTAHVLDGRLEPVPVGSAGELHLGGAGIARGYLGRPAATAGVFVPDPFAPLRGSGGGRLYRTGDLARVRPDGAIEFLGRTDDQVKIRGFRVELGEVESALAAHPDVREVAVLAVEAAPGDRRLAAFVVGGEAPAPTPAPSATSLREWLAERLPAYMVPAAFVALPELPLTPAGKVNRERLPTPGPADWAGLAAGRGPRVPPRTPVEAMLAEIWSEVL
ncbi:MAG: amino acid adenylation domain-containing protein, partial [Acidobacteriota bacterium]